MTVYGRRYAIHIERNSFLETLNFASLTRISNGGVRINQNPELCLVDTVTAVLGGYLESSEDVLRIAGLGVTGVCAGKGGREGGGEEERE